MIDQFNVLAIIPARGGSKRIPGKNIKLLNGKPLIAYAVDEAKKSKYIDRTITSTDSEDIAAVVKSLGSEVPFLRPKEISGDDATDLMAFQHALKWLDEKENYRPEIIVQLRPTSPLRTVVEIDEAIKLLADHPEADSVRTVSEPEQTPYKMYKVGDEGFLEPLLSVGGEKESFNLPQHKLPKAYKHVGYVDVIWWKTLMEKGMMAGEKIIPLVLDKAYSGINKPEDWEYYEFLLDQKQIH